MDTVLTLEGLSRLAILVVGFLTATLLGVVPIRTLLDRLTPPEEISRNSAKTGATIGVLERALIFVFVWNDAFLAMSILAAIKAIAPLHPDDQREMRGYVVAGTLASILWATLWSFTTRFLVLRF